MLDEFDPSDGVWDWHRGAGNGCLFSTASSHTFDKPTPTGGVPGKDECAFQRRTACRSDSFVASCDPILTSKLVLWERGKPFILKGATPDISSLLRISGVLESRPFNMITSAFPYCRSKLDTPLAVIRQPFGY
jgi:hypothetical protein